MSRWRIHRRRIPHRSLSGSSGETNPLLCPETAHRGRYQNRYFRLRRSGQIYRHRTLHLGCYTRVALASFTGKRPRVQVVVIAADHTATRRSKTALRSWSNGASEQGVHKAEGPPQDDPAVKAEMQQIEYVMRRGDRAGLSNYGGSQGATLRLIELRNTSPGRRAQPESRSTATRPGFRAA